MCSRWTGALSAAIIADGGGCISRHTRRKVSALHSRVESGGSCRLDVSLCRESPGMAAGDGLYPVNSLRNVALRAAGTDLVLSLVSGERFCFAHCGVVLPSFHANFLRCIHSPETNAGNAERCLTQQRSFVRLRTSTVCLWRVCTRLFPLLRRTSDSFSCAEEEALLVNPMLGVCRRRQRTRHRRLWLFQRWNLSGPAHQTIRASTPFYKRRAT